METNVYDTLYYNMKQRLTVVNGDNEYSLGKYMMLKAKEKEEKPNLPATITSRVPVALANFASFVSRKLAVKQAPAPERTIKAFPLRTALSAACSALLICTLMFSFGTLNGLVFQGKDNGGYIALSEQMPTEGEEEATAQNEKI